MDEINFKTFRTPTLILMTIGWVGLYLMITQTQPLVWNRWAFFVLLLLALTGTALPIIYFLHKRFPSETPADENIIIRQSLWVGIFGGTLAWLQLGRVVTLYVILGLAGGLIAIEYFIRMREKSNRKIPIIKDDDEHTA